MVKNKTKNTLIRVNCKGILLQRENEVSRRKRMGYLKDHNKKIMYFSLFSLNKHKIMIPHISPRCLNIASHLDPPSSLCHTLAS